MNLATSSSFSGSFNVYAGEDDETKAAPAIIVKVNSTEQIVLRSNVYRVGLTVMVKQMAEDDALAEMDYNFQTLFKDITDTGSSLGSYADNLAVHEVISTNNTKTISGDAISQEIGLELIACLKQ